MKSDVKHTPGPWETLATTVWSPSAKAVIAAASELRATDDVRYTTPRICSDDIEEIFANAKLIAAAPCLLEVVQRLSDWGGDAAELKELCLVADNVLAKATGQPTPAPAG